MKTQHFGLSGLCLLPPHSAAIPRALGLFFTLKIYRQNRENGEEYDNPNRNYPEFGLNSITTWEGFDRDFTYEVDKQKGWPEKFKGPDGKEAERYWYVIKYKPSGQMLAGFSRESAFEKGDGCYLYKFTDTHCPTIRQWMEEKDLNYLRRLKRENPALFQTEFADLKAKNPAHPAIYQLISELKIKEQCLTAEQRQQEERRVIVWDLWKLPAQNECNNYLQWSPEEVLEDVLSFLK